MSTPATVINICSGVKLDPRYEHTIYFASASAQQTYFAGKVVKTLSAYSYVRRSWNLQVEATMSQARRWNYLWFENPQDAKRYYFFITQIEYKNDATVELTLEMDVIQSYLFEFELLQCFIERQHTTTDEPGDNTLDEGLELGELVDNYVQDATELTDLCVLVLATINPNYTETTQPVDALAGTYDGVFSGLKVWAVSDFVKWGQQIEKLSAAGFIDGIVNMWMYPKALVTLGGENTWDDSDICKTVEGCGANLENNKVGRLIVPSARPDTIDGYTPKNKKLLTYPYNFLYVSNNSGSSAVYRYERWDDHPVFAVNGSLSPDGTTYLSPLDYNHVRVKYDWDMEPVTDRRHFEQGLSLAGFPSCSWDSDMYKLWLAQNQNQHLATNVAGGAMIAAGATTTAVAIGTGAGLLSGDVGRGAEMMANGAAQIGQLLAQKADMAITPPQARGNFAGSVTIANGKHTFSFYNKSVCAENARIIDDYFTMYGYKINRVQKPNINARPAYTYVKTIDCHIKGNMCTDDIIKIEKIFDKGITFWKNGDKVADYSQSNTL